MKKFSNAATAIEYISSRADASSTIFVYDLAEHVGFGSQTLNWSAEDDNATSATRLQTRDGAGLTLVGRLSQGTSKSIAQGTAVTAYTTPAGLTAIIPSFAFLPEATDAGHLVLQVSFIAGNSSAI
jgi:sulfite reductase (NADPH) flavoprotein alpha-component